MAEGSKAALQMQQNFAAAPDVKQAHANFMQEQQFKLQQEQANLEKTRLNSLVAESGFKAAEESKFKLQALTKSTDWKGADDAARLRMAAAVQMESGDVEGGAKTLASSEIFDAKKLVAEQKRLDQQAQVIGNAYGVLETIPDDQVDNFVNRLPKPQQDALVSQIGRENWEAMDGTQKKEATRNLMLNAKGQLLQLKFEADAKKQEAINASRERIAIIQANWHKAVAAAGIGNKSGATTKDDTAQTRLFFQQQNKNDAANKSRRLELDAAVNDAQTNAEKYRLFGVGQETATTKLENAIAARTAFEVQIATKDFDSASLLPDGTTKTRILAEIKRRVTALGVVTPDDESADNSKPQDSDAKTANAPPVKGVAAPGAASTSSATPAAPAAAAVPSNTATPAAASTAPPAAPVVLTAPPGANADQIATVVAAQEALRKNPDKAPQIIAALNKGKIPFITTPASSPAPADAPVSGIVPAFVPKVTLPPPPALVAPAASAAAFKQGTAAAVPASASAAKSTKPIAASAVAPPIGQAPFTKEEKIRFKSLEPGVHLNGDVVVKSGDKVVIIGKSTPGLDNPKNIKEAQDLIKKWMRENSPDEQLIANLPKDQRDLARRFIATATQPVKKITDPGYSYGRTQDKRDISNLPTEAQAAVRRLAATVTPAVVAPVVAAPASKLHPVGTKVDIDWSGTTYATRNIGMLTKGKDGKWRSKSGAVAVDPKIIAKAEAAAAE
jgi:hypothetical protein